MTNSEAADVLLGLPESVLKRRYLDKCLEDIRLAVEEDRVVQVNYSVDADSVRKVEFTYRRWRWG